MPLTESQVSAGESHSASLPRQEFGRFLKIREASNPFRAVNRWINDGRDRCTVLLAAVTELVRIAVDELVSARADQPVNEISLRVLAFIDGPRMLMSAGVDIGLLQQHRCLLRSVLWIPDRIAGKVMRRMNANTLAVREYELESGLPIFNRDHWPRISLDQIRAIVPGIVIAENVTEPVDLAVFQKVLGEFPCLLFRHLLVGVEPDKSAYPVVGQIPYIAGVKPLSIFEKLDISAEQWPIAPVIINVWVADKRQPDWLVRLDLDLHPAPRLSGSQMPVEPLTSLLNQIFRRQFA